MAKGKGRTQVKKGTKVKKAELTEATIKKIAAGIRAGQYAENAAVLAGVSESGYYRWMMEGRGKLKRPDGRLVTPRALTVKLVEEVEAAYAHSENVLVQRIQNAGMIPEQWRANAWLLERRVPHRYNLAHKVQAEVTGADGEPLHGVLVVPAALTVEQWAAKQREVLEQQQAEHGAGE